MIKRWILVIIGIMGIVAVLSFVGNANAKTIYVGPGEEYTSIQDAIDNATDGDVIIVRDGIYYENIKVTKERLTIKSENGSDNCIIDGGDRNRSSVIVLKANGTTIEGFTIRNSFTGIEVLSYSNNIMYNNISNNGGDGIWLWASDNNNIAYNNISNNGYAIWIEESNNNNIAYNKILKNGGSIWIELSNNNRVTFNDISNNEEGVSVIFSFHNSIMKNNFINNGWQAFFFASSQNRWLRNYWDNWKIILPRPIFGLFWVISTSSESGVAIPIPWVNFDWFPAMRPYNIDY